MLLYKRNHYLQAEQILTKQHVTSLQCLLYRRTTSLLEGQGKFPEPCPIDTIFVKIEMKLCKGNARVLDLHMP